MNKNALIVMTLLCIGQGYGSDRIVPSNENPKTDGNRGGDNLLRLVGYTAETTLVGVGGFMLLNMVAGPALAGYFGWQAIAIYKTAGFSAWLGFVRGLNENDNRRLKLLEMAHEKQSNTQDLTDASAKPSTDQEELQNAKFSTSQDETSRKEIAFILSQKPADSLLTDKEFLSKYFHDLILLSQSNGEENYENITMSSSTSSSKTSPLETSKANRMFFEEENNKKIHTWLSVVGNSSVACQDNGKTSTSASSSNRRFLTESYPQGDATEK